ncbi:MAG: Mut7-C RNAse domain-containing protein [Sulfolobales archaeon]
MKFIADSMLGNLARWLRLLGYDTLYFRNIEDWKLLNLARDEGRILLTKDLGLYRKSIKRGITSIYIESSDIAESLALISRKLGIKLRFDGSNTRCPLCNTLLVNIPKAEALHLIPPEICRKYDNFWRCPRCFKVFWQGNHWGTIGKIIDEANNLVKSSIVGGGNG